MNRSAESTIGWDKVMHQILCQRRKKTLLTVGEISLKDRRGDVPSGMTRAVRIIDRKNCEGGAR